MGAAIAESFDAIVIGSGQGGNPLALSGRSRKEDRADRASGCGRTRINRGCTPTKTMVASARAAYIARRGADPVSVSARHRRHGWVVREKRAIVRSFREGNEKRLQTRMSS